MEFLYHLVGVIFVFTAIVGKELYIQFQDKMRVNETLTENPASNKLIENAKDNIVSYVNCEYTFTDPKTDLCSNCGKDIFVKTEYRTCKVCGSDYDHELSNCPICG